MQPLTTTTALLHSLRAESDGPTWDVFVDRYSPILQRVARRVGLSDADAADAAQQTLLEFVRDMRLGRFDRTRGRLRSWILSIAEHRSRDIQRCQARSAERFAGACFDLDGAAGLAEDAQSRARNMEAWWDEEERAYIAIRAWEEEREAGGHDPRSLRAFELVGLREVPPAEAARELGMSIEGIYSAKYRIAQRLRERIERLTAFYREDVL